MKEFFELIFMYRHDVRDVKPLPSSTGERWCWNEKQWNTRIDSHTQQMQTPLESDVREIRLRYRVASLVSRHDPFILF